MVCEMLRRTCLAIGRTDFVRCNGDRGWDLGGERNLHSLFPTLSLGWGGEVNWLIPFFEMFSNALSAPSFIEKVTYPTPLKRRVPSSVTIKLTLRDRYHRTKFVNRHVRQRWLYTANTKQNRWSARVLEWRIKNPIPHFTHEWSLHCLLFPLAFQTVTYSVEVY